METKLITVESVRFVHPIDVPGQPATSGLTADRKRYTLFYEPVFRLLRVTTTRPGTNQVQELYVPVEQVLYFKLAATQVEPPKYVKGGKRE